MLVALFVEFVVLLVSSCSRTWYLGSNVRYTSSAFCDATRRLHPLATDSGIVVHYGHDSLVLEGSLPGLVAQNPTNGLPDSCIAILGSEGTAYQFRCFLH